VNGQVSRFVLFLAIATGCVVGQATPKPKAQRSLDVPSLTSERLLIQSYLQGMQFVPEERAFLLTRLHDAAQEINSSLAVLWAEETFQLTFDLAPSWNRLSHQKNSLITLSRFDSRGAMELFASLDVPIDSKDSLLPEDMRAQAAVTIFGRFWKAQGVQGLDLIRVYAKGLGETGQYPYLAMAALIKDLSATDPPQAESIYAEATAYYRKPSKYRDSDAKFARFILDTEKYLSVSLRKSALEAVLERVERQKPRVGDGELVVAARSSAVNFATTQPEFLVLLRLLPAFEHVDPEWRKQLINKYPALSVEAAQPRIETAFVGGAPGTVDDSVKQRVLERTRLSQLRQLLAKDEFQQAAELSDSFTNRDLRATAFALLAGKQYELSPKNAKQRLTDSKKLIDGLEPNAAKVAALAEFAASAYVLSDEDSAAQAWEKGFDLGEELFRQEVDARPGTAAYVTQVYDSMNRLIEIGVRHAKQRTLERLSQVRNDVLHANLKIDTAAAMQAASFHAPR
jgi:hypothetical protein